MPTPDEARQALKLIGDAAVQDATSITSALSGSPESRRLDMLDTLPAVIAMYADAAASLAADMYDNERELAGLATVYAAVPVVDDRTVKIRRSIAWAADPFFEADGDVDARAAEVVQYETTTPYRTTIVDNSRRDPDSIGWRREAAHGCRFCRMLADKGAVYMRDTAYFAAHPHCTCTAVQVFRGGRRGPEASVMQYMASKRHRTPRERARLRDWLDVEYGPE